MNICFFGSYNPTYSRNKILIDGLKKNGVRILECRSTKESFMNRYPELARKYWILRKQVDILYVGFMGHLDMPLAWFLARLTGKKVVFDMFYSMYDTYVFDRQSTQPRSLRARSFYLIDKIAVTLADLVVTDTQTHANYFIKLLKLNPHKFRRVFLGGDDSLFRKSEISKKQRKIIIEFHGMFTRLQGAEFFIKAAKLLENLPNVEFWLIGGGKNYPVPFDFLIQLKPKTLKYFPELTVNQLNRKIQSASISIGHLGNTHKAHSVISNKMYHALFLGLPLIAPDNPATKELLTNNKNAFFVKMADSADLANKIRQLLRNSKLRRKIGKEGLKLANTKLRNEILGKNLLTVIKEGLN